MGTKQTRPDPVVSVRVSREVLARLDRLAGRTGRSKGMYIRLALEHMLPEMEATFWAHSIRKEADAELLAFGEIMAQFNDEGPSTNPRS